MAWRCSNSTKVGGMKSSQVQLPSRDKQFLKGFRSKGQHSARETTRAHILLALEAGVPTVQMQKVLGVSRMVIWRARSAYQEKGLDYALYDAARPGSTSQVRHGPGGGSGGVGL